jgi:hypothetical protein
VTTVAQSTPVAAVPDGGWLACAGDKEPGCLNVYSADGARRAPLASQPDLRGMSVLNVPVTAGLWLTGEDPATGHAAVAVSRDRGRSWSTRVLVAGQPAQPNCPSGEIAQVATIDGTTAYAVISCTTTSSLIPSGTGALVLRTGDGGLSWQRADHGGNVPFTAGDATYLAADGSHVVEKDLDHPTNWYLSRDGGASYQKTALHGLPDTRLDQPDNGEVQGAVRVVAPGLYLAFDRSTLYRSANGLDWTRVPITVPSH